MSLLRRIALTELQTRPRLALDPTALELARSVEVELRRGGLEALRAFAQRWDGIEPDEPLILERPELDRARDQLDAPRRELLERSAGRIEGFARAQMGCLQPLDTAIMGGRAGHRIDPLRTAGCYAPGGRYPLPSSILMTAVPARVAGVEHVVVASPRPNQLMRAAASIAGAQQLLCAGGAQAIAALAHGVGNLPACEIIVGPGNAYVTAAKFLASAFARIDMLAGPSELLIVAGEDAEARVVAADLLAQAEHDVQALPFLVSDSEILLDAVEEELAAQLAELDTGDVARVALSNGASVLAPDLEQAIALSNRLAPEHLQLMGETVEKRAKEFRSFGALFMGKDSGEVLGDYAAGPNHVLPTGGTAAQRGGLSVLDFLAVRSWMQLDGGPAARQVAQDAEELARIEGLSGHVRAAAHRRR